MKTRILLLAFALVSTTKPKKEGCCEVGADSKKCSRKFLRRQDVGWLAGHSLYCFAGVMRISGLATHWGSWCIDWSAGPWPLPISIPLSRLNGRHSTASSSKHPVNFSASGDHGALAKRLYEFYHPDSPSIITKLLALLLAAILRSHHV